MFQLDLWIPALPLWAAWTLMSFTYLFGGMLLSAYYAYRAKKLQLGCGKACCPGNICGVDDHMCGGESPGLENEREYWKGYLLCRSASPFVWPFVIIGRLVVAIVFTINFSWRVGEMLATKYHRRTYGA
jgi:hypothetical protein